MGGRVDELEGSKAKLSARLTEAEETIESLNQKVSSTEKTKHRLETELEDIQLEYERVHAAAIITEKRGRNFDKVVGEWKAKVDDLSSEIDASQKEARNYNSELFRLKAAWDETVEQLDVVKRENKNLADEIKDLRAQLELGQVRQEIDRKIQEKEEEFNNTRKNHQRAMDSLQASLEAESRAKAEALRIKKKLESDINELEIALDHSNKANSEAHKSIKRYQGQLRDTEGLLEAETSQKIEITEKAGLAERKANALQGELEESRALLDSADRSKKQTDMELAEARSAVNDMTTINSKAASEKRHLESAIHTMHAEIDDMLRGAKGSEDKAKKAMVDAARLADELRAEQDHCAAQEKAKRALTTQLGELDARLD